MNVLRFGDIQIAILSLMPKGVEHMQMALGRIDYEGDFIFDAERR